MSAIGSVTYWIEQLKAGDPKAAQQLWQGYFRRLVGLAQAKLRGAPCRMADGEDVALSAFKSLCLGAEAGRFPRLDDRDDLWQLLVLLADRKAVNLRQHETRAKRGGGKVSNESDRPPGGPNDFGLAFGQVIGKAPEPDPALVVQVAEECRRLLALLGEEELRSVAVWKLEGYGNEEIAAKLNRSVKTVERKLGLIRKTWEKELAHE